MIYLACPYTHEDAAVRELRFHAACRATAQLIREGQTVFCPVVHSHPLTQHGLPTEWTFWERIDGTLLRACDELVVLTLDGWEQSVGVLAEVSLATSAGKRVRYVAPVVADVEAAA